MNTHSLLPSLGEFEGSHPPPRIVLRTQTAEPSPCKVQSFADVTESGADGRHVKLYSHDTSLGFSQCTCDVVAGVLNVRSCLQIHCPPRSGGNAYVEAEPAPSMACPCSGVSVDSARLGTGILNTVRKWVLKQALPPRVSRLKHPVAQILPRVQSSTFPPGTRWLATAPPSTDARLLVMSPQLSSPGP